MADPFPPPPPGFIPMPGYQPTPEGGAPPPPPGFVPMPDERFIDTQTGAPANVRMAVGAAVTPKDRLATIRKVYPDAQPYKDGNFVYTDPRTGRPTLYNEPGWMPSFGDIASIMPEIAEFAGGTMGGAAAVAAAPPTGGSSLLAVPAGIGLGAAGARELAQLYANRMLGTVDTRGLPERLTDAAITGGVNAVGARAGELLGQGLGKGIGAVRSALGGRTGADVLREFTEAGVRPTAGAVTGNRGWQITEQGLTNTPGGARVMQDVFRQQMDDIARATGQIVDDIGRPGTAQTAGETLQGGAGRAAERFRGRQEGLYNRAFGMIGADTPVQPQAVGRLTADMQARLAQAPAALDEAITPALGRAQGLLDDAAAQGGIPFDAFREARTGLGKALKAPGITPSQATGQARQRALYGAMTDDIGAVAQQAGPDAARAMRRADQYTRALETTRMPMLDKLASFDAPEKAFDWAMGEAKSGGTRLATLRRSMAPEEWDTLASTVLDRMGRATPGNRGAAELGGAAHDFSASTFLTNWEKMAPEARRALFGGRRYAGAVDDLDRLVAVMNRTKDSARMVNSSGTARNTIAGGSMALATERILAGNPGGAAGIIASTTVAPYITAKMMTHPAFVRWLVNAEAAGATSPMTMGGMIGRLGAVAKAAPELREEIETFRRQLEAERGGK